MVQCLLGDSNHWKHELLQYIQKKLKQYMYTELAPNNVV